MGISCGYPVNGGFLAASRRIRVSLLTFWVEGPKGRHYPQAEVRPEPTHSQMGYFPLPRAERRCRGESARK
jgi:hypothetical protein